MPKIEGYTFSIDLDDRGVGRKLQTIKQEAYALKNAMRTNFEEIRAGEGVMAAYANKVTDAENAIKAQNVLIERLRKEQSGLNTDTDKGQKAWLRYENQINAAKRAINSLTAQQEKARQISSQENQLHLQAIRNLETLTKRTDEVRNATSRVTDITTSYAHALETEGRTNEAARAKLKGLESVRKSLEIQLKQEKLLLQETARVSGETSSAYQSQKAKVEDLTLSYRQNEAEIRNQIKVTKMWPEHASFSLEKVKNKFTKITPIAFAAVSSVTAATSSVISKLEEGSEKASELSSQYNVIKNNLVTGGESVVEATRAVAIMQSDGEKYSLKYGKSQKDIADAYLELVKRGYTSKQAIGAMNTELQGSIASGDDFSDVVEVASQTLEGFGMTVDKNGKQLSSTREMTVQTKKAVNTLAYSADVTSTSFQSLGIGMSYVSATAHQAGFSLSETASAMGVLNNNGLEADKALVKLAA